MELKLKLRVIKRGFPHDDTAVFLPGVTPNSGTKFAMQDVVFKEDVMYADGVQGLFAETETDPGLSEITVVGPYGNGLQKVYSEHEIGKFFTK